MRAGAKFASRKISQQASTSNTKIITIAKGKVYQYKETSAGLSYNLTGNQVPEQPATLLKI
jgi:hypothetical protein